MKRARAPWGLLPMESGRSWAHGLGQLNHQPRDIMKWKLLTFTTLSVIIASCIGILVFNPKASKATPTTAPSASVTSMPVPPDPGGQEADQALADRIHLALVAERALSQKAQNIKIFTLDSFVTLNGTVNSGEEKRMVGEIAMSIAGQDKVDNQLYVR